MILEEELRVCKRVIPELTELLLEADLMTLEKSGRANIIGLFKEIGKPGALVPKMYGGMGCSLEEVTSILRFVGAHCPSLALAMTMHHHTVASFVFDAVPMEGAERLLKRIASDSIISSAFSEARTSGDILRSSVGFSQDDAGVAGTICGNKKPVSMSNDSDFVLVSVYENGNTDNRGLVLIDRSVSVVEVEDFWAGDILSAADNQCLVFNNTFVQKGDMLVPLRDKPSQTKVRMLVADAEIAISVLFQVMMCSAYLGLASKICQMYITSKFCTSAQRLDILSRLESAMFAVKYFASKMNHKNLTNQLGGMMLTTHHAIHQVNQTVTMASSQLGEKGYLNNEEALYIVLSSKCINYHPPSTDYKHSIVDLKYANMSVDV